MDGVVTGNGELCTINFSCTDYFAGFMCKIKVPKNAIYSSKIVVIYSVYFCLMLP